MDAIDLVIPWVDGSDPQWLKERKKYYANCGDNSEARFRDWGTLKYVFRSIEKYAPWIRTVHFVTWGHLPPWLDTTHPKLHVVRHADYIPQEYLPTFNSHTIELNFHRIEGLADRFIYFNDDCLFTKPTSPEYFFKNGLPCDTFAMDDIYFGKNSIGWIYGSNTAVINDNFRMREVVKRQWRKVFHPSVGLKKLIKNAAHSVLNSWFPGFWNSHVSSAFLKETFAEVWEKEFEILDQTCRSRFRGETNVSQHLLRNWQLVTGRFTPLRIGTSQCYHLTDQRVEGMCNAITKNMYHVICMNDTGRITDLDWAITKILEALETIFPQKSSFEK